MDCWLIALGLALCCLVRADEKKPSEDYSQMDGDWYGEAIATNCNFLKRMVSHMPRVPTSIKSESPDKVEMNMWMPMRSKADWKKGMKSGQHSKSECKNKTMILTRDKDGVLSSECRKHGMKKVVKSMETDGANYIFHSFQVTHKNGTCQTAAALLKNPDGYEEYRVPFERFVGKEGLDTKDITILRKEGMCPFPK